MIRFHLFLFHWKTFISRFNHSDGGASFLHSKYSPKFVGFQQRPESSTFEWDFNQGINEPDTFLDIYLYLICKYWIDFGQINNFSDCIILIRACGMQDIRHLSLYTSITNEVPLRLPI